MRRFVYSLLIFALPIWASGEKPIECVSEIAKLGKELGPIMARFQNEMADRIPEGKNPLREAAFHIGKRRALEEQFAEIIPGYDELVRHVNQPELSADDVEPIIKKVFRGVEKVKSDPKASPVELVGAIEALSWIQEAFHRVRPTAEQSSHQPESQSLNPSEKAEKKPDSEPNSDAPGKSSDSEDHEGEDGNSAGPKWKKPSDSYEISNSSGKKKPRQGPPVFLTKYDVETPSNLLPQVIYDQVSGTGAHRAASHRPVLELGSDIGEMRALELPNGQKLPVPYGAFAYAPKDAPYEIHADDEGEFVFTWKAGTTPLPDVSIPLRKITGRKFRNPAEEVFYLENSGIPLSAWPKDIRDLIGDLKRLGQTNREQLADVVTKHLRESGLYRYHDEKMVPQDELKKADAEVRRLTAGGVPKAVAMAQTKIFRCDSAAAIAALLLKDHLNVPTRMVGGKVVAAEVRENGKNWSATVEGVEDHGWIEIWNGRDWVVFDGTPQGVRPNAGEGEKTSDNSDKTKKPDPSGGESQAKGQREQDSPPSEPKPSEGPDGEFSDRSARQTQSNPNDKSPSPTQVSEKAVSSPEPKPKPSNQPHEPSSSLVDHAPSREIKPNLKLLEDKGEREDAASKRLPLLMTLMETLEVNALERAIVNNQNVETLRESIEGLTKMAGSHLQARTAATPSIRRLQTEQSIQRDYLQHSLSDSVGQIRYLAGQGKFRDAWKRLKEVESQITRLSKLRSLASNESDLLYQIRKILEGLRTIRHKDSQAYDAMERVMSRLSGTFSRQVVRDLYGDVSELGGQAVLNLAADLKSGKLARLHRLALLKDYADMVLNRTIEPTIEEEKTLQRSPVPRKNNSDLVITQSIYDFDRMILDLKPGEPWFAELFRGNQFALGTREIRAVKGFKEPVERKMTVVYYDVSGSMGEYEKRPVQIQQDLIALFIDKALSERDRLGNPTHEVMLVPVNSEVGEGRWIRSSEEALAFMRDYLTSDSAPLTEGSTNLTAPFLNFYDTVGQTYRKSLTGPTQQRLKKANFILFTDGEDPNFDLTSVRDARTQVPAEVELYLNYVGIWNANETLEMLAKESKLGSAKPLHRLLSEDDINKINSLSNTIEFDPDAFATKQKTAPNQVVLNLNQLGRIQPVDFVGMQIPAKVATKLASIQVDPSLTVPSERRADLDGLRSALIRLFATKPDTRFRAQIAANLIAAQERVTGRSLSQLSATEAELFRAIDQWMSE